MITDLIYIYKKSKQTDGSQENILQAIYFHFSVLSHFYTFLYKDNLLIPFIQVNGSKK